MGRTLEWLLTFCLISIRTCMPDDYEKMTLASVQDDRLMLEGQVVGGEFLGINTMQLTREAKLATNPVTCTQGGRNE